MFWRRRRSDLDFADEIASHIQIEADRLQSEGLPAGQALETAQRTFGNVAQARAGYRIRQHGVWFDLLRDDLRDGVRSLRKAPGFTLAAVLSLALGIGLNTAVFTLLYSVLLRPLPLPDGDRLVSIHHQFGNLNRWVNGTSDMVSYPEYAHHRERTRTLSGLAAHASMSFTVSGELPVSGNGLLVSCNYFTVLGVTMTLGRGFVERDCQPDGDGAVVLGHGFWQRQFGGAADIVGRTVTINRRNLRVIGVTGSQFRGTSFQVPDLWAPLALRGPLSEGGNLIRGRMVGATMGDPGSRAGSHFGNLGEPYESWLALVGRLQHDATIESARAELNGIARQADALYAGRTTDVIVHPVTRGGAQAQEYRLFAVGVLSLSALVLLIACLNLMGLLLARAPARQLAMRIRLALGASRGRVLSNLLTESALLAIFGCAAGLALAFWFPGVVLALLPIRGVALDLTPDLRVFGFAFVVSVLAVLVFGLAPALEISRVDLASAMRGDSAGGGRARGISRTRQVVLCAQVSGSLVLLVLAGLFVRGLRHAQSTDPGFFVEDIYAIRPALGQQGYNAARAVAYFRDLQTRVAALPGVTATALATRLPLGGRTTSRLALDDAPVSTAQPQISFARVTGEYFGTMGIPIVRGRALNEADTRAGEPLPAVISENMARSLWPDQNPLGKQFRAHPKLHVVVGVARDARNLSIVERDPMFFYMAVNLTETPEGAGPAALIVRTSGAAALGPSVFELSRAIDPNVLVTVQSLEEQLSDEFLGTRLAALFGGVFGMLATLLAAIGVYGAIDYAAAQRKREIGLRLALGATPRNVVAMVMRDGAGPVVTGVLIGVSLAVAASRLVRGLLYGLSPLDPIAFLVTIGLLAAAALIAMYRPARQAAQLDPLRTLRAD